MQFLAKAIPGVMRFAGSLFWIVVGILLVWVTCMLAQSAAQAQQNSTDYSNLSQHGAEIYGRSYGGCRSFYLWGKPEYKQFIFSTKEGVYNGEMPPDPPLKDNNVTVLYMPSNPNVSIARHDITHSELRALAHSESQLADSLSIRARWLSLACGLAAFACITSGIALLSLKLYYKR